MQPMELAQILALLQRKGYDLSSSQFTTPYAVAKWFVGQDRIPGQALEPYGDSLSPAELLKILLDYQILTPADLQERVRHHTPAPRRWRLGYGATHSPFGDLEQTDRMLAGLEKLAEQGPLRVRFSNLSGAVRTLRGNLLPNQVALSGAEMVRLGNEFLTQHTIALLGEGNTAWVSDAAPVIGNVARFQQLALDKFPIYGAKAHLGFDNSGRLTFINSSGFPLSSADNVNFEFRLQWEEAVALAEKFLAQRYRLQNPGFYHSPNSRSGLIIYPYLKLRGRPLLDLPPTAGAYRAAWAIWVVDEVSRASWEVIVDDASQAILNPATTELWVNVPFPLAVYADNAAAHAGNVSHPSVEIGGATGLHDVADFPTNFTALMPLTEWDNPAFAAAQLRTSNVYYHLRQAESTFAAVYKAAWPGIIGAPVAVPGQEQAVQVELLAGSGLVGRYSLATPTTPRTIQFDSGQASSQITDPMVDCEVIYHEYAHAVFDNVQPDLFRVSSPELFRNALNEGLAFYFGVSLSYRLSAEPADRPGAPAIQWGEVAYGSSDWTVQGWRDVQRPNPSQQRPNHDFLPVYGLFPQYALTDHDPANAGSEYSCGLAWARVLWDMRRVLGPTLADAIILRALSVTGGIQTELETPTEAILHYASEQPLGGVPHEVALSLLFSQRGILADTPINALHTLKWQGQSYLLAATEQNNQVGGSGCMISTDEGLTWQALGQGGPDDVVALSNVQITNPDGTAQLLIFAAGEFWPTTGSAPIQAIYQYQATSSPLKLSDAWQLLPASLPANLAVNSLQSGVIPEATNHFWLFAGTEQGLHIYDSRTQQWAEFQAANRILATAYQATNPPAIWVSIKEQTGSVRRFSYQAGQAPAWQPQSMPPPTSEVILTLQADATSNEFVWVGTLAGTIYRLTNAGNWIQVAQVAKPIFSLWVEMNELEQRIIYAGTTHGVVQVNGAQNISPLASALTGETLAYTTVLAVQRLAGQLWFGTAQRGLWRYDESAAPAQRWQRQSDGFPRLGQWVEVSAPPSVCPWSHTFNQTLQADQLATHLLYVPDQSCTELRLTVNPDNGLLQPKLFYVAADVDLSKQQWAGLQPKELNADWVMEGPIQPGFYLLAVKALAGLTYQLIVDLT